MLYYRGLRRHPLGHNKIEVYGEFRCFLLIRVFGCAALNALRHEEVVGFGDVYLFGRGAEYGFRVHSTGSHNTQNESCASQDL